MTDSDVKYKAYDKTACDKIQVFIQVIIVTHRNKNYYLKLKLAKHWTKNPPPPTATTACQGYSKIHPGLGKKSIKHYRNPTTGKGQTIRLKIKAKAQ